MILKHEIQYKNNEEVLVIHLDYNYEFAKIGGKRKGIIHSITDYIKERKIKFNGKKIVLVVGTLILGTVFLTAPIYNNYNNNKDTYTYVSKIALANYDEKEQLSGIEEIDVKNKTVEEKKVQSVKPKEDTTQSKKTTTNKTSSTKKVTKSTNSKTSTNKKTSTKPQTKPNVSQTKPNTSQAKPNTSQTKPNNNTTVKPETSNQTIVTVHRSNGQIVKIELEQYLIGVIGAEMPASFSPEALKAQAVVSRTYTLKAISNGKKLTDTVSTQAYKDNNQLKSMWGSSYNTYYNKIKNAVNATKGMYITYNNKYIDAVFHSTSNGYTEDSGNVWNNSYPYLKSVASPWDKSASSYERTTSISYDQASKILGFNINKSTPIKILSKNKSGRIASIMIGNKTYTGVKFRTLFNLRSADFDIKLNDKIEITTKGYGHGVGMSQYGANGMAKAGYNYNQIIKHYYTGVSINK